MVRKKEKQDNVKIIFSLISLLLMIPPLINGDGNYYRTVFIFLINRVIDLFFKRKIDDGLFFAIWAEVNQWIGVGVCALAFCSMVPDFAQICLPYAKKINLGLFISAVSFVANEGSGLIVCSAKENLIKSKIKNDINGMNGKGE